MWTLGLTEAQVPGFYTQETSTVHWWVKAYN